jgi:FlaA1/EpsC-like NDP-sugar epimerase
MTNTILVLGATGNVGSQVVKQLAVPMGLCRIMLTFLGKLSKPKMLFIYQWETVR